MLGIEIRQVPLPGMIAMYEEHLVRIELRYTIDQWYAMTPEKRAFEVAVMRIKNAVEYQKNKEHERRAEREARRKK